MKYFSKDHEWITIEGDVATVGISAHAAAELGDVTFVELPELDTDVNAGDSVSAGRISESSVRHLHSCFWYYF